MNIRINGKRMGKTIKKNLFLLTLASTVAVSGLGFGGNVGIVKAETVDDSGVYNPDNIKYELDAQLEDENNYQELWVGDKPGISAVVYDEKGQPLLNNQWSFLGLMDGFEGSEYDVKFFYGTDVDHSDHLFEGRIPESAFGNYIFANVWVYVDPNKMLFQYAQSKEPVKMAFDAYAVSKLSNKEVAVSTIFETETSATIPATVTIDGKKYKLTKIGENALQKNAKLKKVTIGSNVTTIEKNAFNGASKLTNVVISGNIKSVGKDAFKGINKKAVVKIKASDSNYKKMVKLIKKSGIPKTVKFKRVAS